MEGSMNGEFFESMGNEEFNLPTTNGGHATAKNLSLIHI